jgi:hypothetical protein
MSLIFSPQTRTLVAGSLLRSMSTYVLYSGPNAPVQWSVTVFGGAQPTAAAIAADWTQYNASPNMLVHFTNPSFYLVQPGNMLQMSTAPTPKNAMNTGIATWAIIWGGTNGPAPVTDVAIVDTPLPRTRFMVVPVSDSIGNGVVRLDSTSLTVGVPAAIGDVTLGFNL